MISTVEPLVMAVVTLASQAYDVPRPLIAAVIQRESSFNLHAVGDHDEDGNAHSFGPMQLNDQGAGHGWPVDSLLNWQLNIMIGTNYLKHCLDAFPHNKKLAISAYNQGVGGAARRGYGHNEQYVNDVLQFEQEFQDAWGK